MAEPLLIISKTRLADIVAKHETAKALEESREVAGCNEVREMCSELVIALVAKTYDRSILVRLSVFDRRAPSKRGKIHWPECFGNHLSKSYRANWPERETARRRH